MKAGFGGVERAGWQDGRIGGGRLFAAVALVSLWSGLGLCLGRISDYSRVRRSLQYGETLS